MPSPLRHFLSLAVAALAILPASVPAKEKDTFGALDARVQTIFETSYAEKCRSLMADQNLPPSQPAIYQITFNYANEDTPPRPYRIYEYLCFEGPYNQGYVYYGADEYEEIYPLHFAVPAFDVVREIPDDYLSPAKSITVTGFSTTDMLINPEFDPATATVSTFEKWSGLADTFSSGQWQFRDGNFVLQTYDVDADSDEKRAPMRIYGEGKPEAYD